jgi:hypothetical protein
MGAATESLITQEMAGPAPPRWVAPLFTAAALALLPWIGVLVVALPSTHRAAHWDLAWGGFDVALAALLAAVATAARRGSPWLEGAATAAATLLIVDAWFDVLTSSTGTELALALAEAVLVELPLAGLCLLLARGAERRLRASPPRQLRVLPGGGEDSPSWSHEARSA